MEILNLKYMFIKEQSIVFLSSITPSMECRKGAGHIGPLFPEFRGWPLWFMASIALRGPQHLAPEVVPGSSLHSEALSPEFGRECQETGDCGPTRHVGAGRWGLLGPIAHGLLGRRHPGPRFSHMVG